MIDDSLTAIPGLRNKGGETFLLVYSREVFLIKEFLFVCVDGDLYLKSET